jgi:hypothetical protein
MVNISFSRFNGFAWADQKPLKRLKALSVDPAHRAEATVLMRGTENKGF